MNAADLAFAPAWKVRDMVASKEVSPRELVDLFLDRIDSLDPKLNSYLTVTADLARETAAEAEAAVARGDDLGPLHGVPISIKDLEFSKGIRSTMGCYVFRDHVPDEDSVAVERVRQAGAIILGKTNTPEFGQSGTTENLLGEACRNPWNTERTSGRLQRRRWRGPHRRPLLPRHRLRRRRLHPYPRQLLWRLRYKADPAPRASLRQRGPRPRHRQPVLPVGPHVPHGQGLGHPSASPLGPRRTGPNVPQGPSPRLHVGPK